MQTAAATLTPTEIDSLRTRIADAVNDGWTGADWTHPLVRESGPALDTDGDERMCDGTAHGCVTCSLIRSDAAIAREHARMARAALRAGDISTALAELVEAAEIEREYGDAPIYGPLARALALAVEES